MFRFSPSNRRLAVAGFIKNKITVFDISIAASQDSKSISLTGVAEISSAYLKSPHGLDFIDDEKILVVNREGQACIFELPKDAMGRYELAPVAVIGADDISTPGSVAVIRKEQGFCEALICNNYVNSVTRHQLDFAAGYSTKKSEVLLKKCLDVPDGICVSREMQWIAVSNHDSHTVLLYENNPTLNGSSLPDGILRSTYYPHGVRFTSDGRFILVADAGSPYVNIYEKDLDWRGVRNPLLSFRVLSHEDYLRGRHTPEDGGAKGIDINNAMNIVVTTCECQPLAFFDLTAILEGACGEFPENWRRTQKALEVNYELNVQEEAEEEVLVYKNSRSWRITAPLRWARHFGKNQY